MGISKIDDIVAYIAYVLSSSPYKTFTEDELVNETMKGVSSPKPRVITCVQSLVAGGFCHGRFVRSKTAGISFKEGGPTGTPYTPPADQADSDQYNSEFTESGMCDADRLRYERMIEDLKTKAEEAFDDLLEKQSTINQKQFEIEEKDQKIKDLTSEIESSRGGIREVHVYKKSNGKPKVVTGTFHKAFGDILTLVEARENIYLYGPTGCGKSHVCHQVSETLGMQFGFVSCSAGMSEGVLGGRMLPIKGNGAFDYVISEYVKIYETGGIFLIDEIDAADANVLLLINASLANGKMAVPNRPSKPYAKRHDGFVCIAAANTIGLGADRNYSGRNRLDDSTMDRFRIGQIYMDYDEEVERALCPDEDLRKFLWTIRRNIREARLERAVSTRFTEKAHKMLSQYNWDKVRICKSLMTGWKASEVQKALSGVDEFTIDLVRQALAL